MAEPATRYAQTRKRLNPWVIALIAVIHLGLFYLLARALAPSAVTGVEQSVVSAFTVTVWAPEEPSEPPEPEPEGAQGDPGREAVPDAVTAPPQPVRRDPPAPRASSTGTADTSGRPKRGPGRADRARVRAPAVAMAAAGRAGVRPPSRSWSARSPMPAPSRCRPAGVPRGSANRLSCG